MIRLETQVHVQQPVQAFGEEPCPHQQHHRDGQFHHDQPRAKPLPRLPGRAAAPFRQAVPRFRESKMQRRREGKQRDGYHRHRARIR